MAMARWYAGLVWCVWLLLLLVACAASASSMTRTTEDTNVDDNGRATTTTTVASNAALNDTKSLLDELLLLRQYGPIYGGATGGAGGVGLGGVGGVGIGGGAGGGGGCPLCDSSVYSYCSYKMLHDACCCDFMVVPQLKPPQCYYSDCTLLYAKTCYEHMLIRNCCCNRTYR